MLNNFQGLKQMDVWFAKIWIRYPVRWFGARWFVEGSLVLVEGKWKTPP